MAALTPVSTPRSTAEGAPVRFAGLNPGPPHERVKWMVQSDTEAKAWHCRGVWEGSVNRLRSSVPETGQASPAQTCAALPHGGCRALVYIFDPSPRLRVHMSETLTATYFYGIPVPLLLLERLADVLRPRPSIPSFPAVEPVTESVPRVGVIRSHSTTMPCDVSSNFLPSPNQAEVPVYGVLHHIMCLVRRSVPPGSYEGASKKKP
jgi:hypothetical protein